MRDERQDKTKVGTCRTTQNETLTRLLCDDRNVLNYGAYRNRKISVLYTHYTPTMLILRRNNKKKTLMVI